MKKQKGSWTFIFVKWTNVEQTLCVLFCALLVHYLRIVSLKMYPPSENKLQQVNKIDLERFSVAGGINITPKNVLNEMHI